MSGGLAIGCIVADACGATDAAAPDGRAGGCLGAAPSRSGAGCAGSDAGMGGEGGGACSRLGAPQPARASAATLWAAIRRLSLNRLPPALEHGSTRKPLFGTESI